jgi:hypothetical protein
MNAYEILEREGFLNEDDSEHVWNLATSKAGNLYEALYSELRSHQYDGMDEPKSPFTFVASANMRAAIGCQNPPCVRQKLEFLAHYASLYCDRVFLPLPLLGSRPRSTPEQKAALQESIRALGILRPVIEAGLVRPVTMTTSHCKHIVSTSTVPKTWSNTAASWRYTSPLRFGCRSPGGTTPKASISSRAAS